MLIIAVDCATPAAGAALSDGEKIIAEYSNNFKQVHSENFMPLIDKCLQDYGCSLKDLDAIAVTVGPGSFTGIRIGMAAVKGLSLGSGVPIIGISTLEAVAYNMVLSDYLVCPVLNARKNEVYAAAYSVKSIKPEILWGPAACPPQVMADGINKLAANCPGIVFLGDGYKPYREIFRSYFGSQIAEVPPHMMQPRAAGIASLAAIKLKQGSFEDVHAIRPYYIRLSEAEYQLGKDDR
ncbi:MAG TPA: tRNA (adenosine(37)-N6)-threonylcarbamoyltransferase complex dimerization subunit type 1 TsaB [Syntrophomonadaceae bacterium]|nr:tRNA (adenosine(37)-N6)-threonylcarbamoyltransferase complex dimerization subunit type 1 TsaB [Syntrophomonadaceae bacterium]HNX29829.1 tRNA (adenosine(37)-N6)-threonylcarbamoyltransferase complex dimerization subunit type 1 TsaB [Syntrophomonadaceae bacterium]HPR92934.1 tRNA (adenosine(37)-N6)-threonylcarbamoyltransferase complex dimerization subunit type 1 TsaB [Syntrophomonadaceae bacterium]